MLFTCTTLLSLIYVEHSQVIQFSHFSVKEFLTSARLAENNNTISHISSTPAHTLVVQACLSTLLNLDMNVTRDILKTFPLAEYAARHWFKYAPFEVFVCVVFKVIHFFRPYCNTFFSPLQAQRRCGHQGRWRADSTATGVRRVSSRARTVSDYAPRRRVSQGCGRLDSAASGVLWVSR